MFRLLYVNCQHVSFEAGFPGGKTVVRNPRALSVGDSRGVGLIPGLGRSGVGNGNLFCILAWKIARTEEPGGLHMIIESDMTEQLSTQLWCSMTPQSTQEAEACQYHWILCMYCSPCFWVTNHPRNEFCRMAESHADWSKSLWATCSHSLCIQLETKLGWTIKNDPCSPGCGSEQLPVNTLASFTAWQLSTKWEEA